MSALKHLHQIHPTARWWLKADGTDIQVGLRESMSNDWSGDVDWGNGDLQQKHKEYLEYVQFVRCMAVKQRRSLATIGGYLQKLLDKMPRRSCFGLRALQKQNICTSPKEGNKMCQKIRSLLLPGMLRDIPNW